MGQIAVIGTGDTSPGDYEAAQTVGNLIAENHEILICGGLSGVMEVCVQRRKGTGRINGWYLARYRKREPVPGYRHPHRSGTCAECTYCPVCRCGHCNRGRLRNTFGNSNCSENGTPGLRNKNMGYRRCRTMHDARRSSAQGSTRRTPVSLVSYPPSRSRISLNAGETRVSQRPDTLGSSRCSRRIAIS